MGRRDIIISIIVVACVAGWFFVRCRGRDPAEAVPRQEAVVVDNLAILPPKETKEGAQDRQKGEMELKKRREEYIQEIRQGIGFYHMEEGKSGLQVKVRFQPFAVCHMGDLNAIFHDYRQGAQNRIILTMESLDQKKKALPPVQISLENMKVGFEKVFTLPKNSPGDIMGIFICSDSKHIGRCVGKKSMDVNATLFKPGKKSEPYVDKIYIFNLAIVTDKLIRFVTTAPISDALLSSLKEQKQPPKLDVQKRAKMLGLAQTLSTQLRSYPAEVRGNLLTIKIPYWSKTGCGTPN